MASKLISPAVLAESWGVHRKTIIRWLEAGELRGYRLGPHTRRVAEDDAAAFLAKQAITGAAEGFGTSKSRSLPADQDVEAGCPAAGGPDHPSTEKAGV
jgi:excisionase family DNA binding protein